MHSKVLRYAMVLTLVAATGVVGCKKKPVQPTGPAGGNPSSIGSGVEINSTGINGGGGTLGTRPDASSAEAGIRGLFSPVYFDYDSAKIKPAEISKLKTVAEALKGNSKKLIVEGHCDERGTSEYNRALGERRAQAARAELTHLGVDGNRLSTISYGKDRPLEPAHDDNAWSRNRRCEFVVLEK